MKTLVFAYVYRQHDMDMLRLLKQQIARFIQKYNASNSTQVKIEVKEIELGVLYQRLPKGNIVGLFVDQYGNNASIELDRICEVLGDPNKIPPVLFLHEMSYRDKPRSGIRYEEVTIASFNSKVREFLTTLIIELI